MDGALSMVGDATKGGHTGLTMKNECLSNQPRRESSFALCHPLVRTQQTITPLHKVCAMLSEQKTAPCY